MRLSVTMCVILLVRHFFLVLFIIYHSHLISKKHISSRGIVNSFVLLNQIGFCGIYILFVAQNLKAVFDEWCHMDVRLYILILLLPLIGLACIRNLKILAPFSIFANIAIIIG